MNYIVLDLETAKSADDCQYCGKPEAEHFRDRQCKPPIGWRELPVDWHPPMALRMTQFSPIGWGNKPALGLSIGCYYDSQDGIIHWFDVHTLQATVQHFVERQPLLVSFNGVTFDFVLMRGLLRRQAETLPPEEAGPLVALCDTFKAQCASSYDVLAEVWKASPESRMAKGLNGLNSLAQANGLGGKTGSGAEAPRLWTAGRVAEVMNYCANDVYLTRALFDLVMLGEPIKRSDGSALLLPKPSMK